MRLPLSLIQIIVHLHPFLLTSALRFGIADSREFIFIQEDEEPTYFGRNFSCSFEQRIKPFTQLNLAIQPIRFIFIVLVRCSSPSKSSDIFDEHSFVPHQNRSTSVLCGNYWTVDGNSLWCVAFEANQWEQCAKQSTETEEILSFPRKRHSSRFE